MAIEDARGLTLSRGSAKSIETYDEALTLLHGYYGDPLATIDQALAAEPDFLMGLAMRAALIVTTSEKRFEPELRATVRRAQAVIQSGGANAREIGHIEAAAAWLEGDFAGATDRYNRLALEYPRDGLALQVSHLCNFFLGRPTWLRDHIAAAIPHLEESEPLYGYAHGMLAFGLEECRQFDRAEAAGRKALDCNPRDPWAMHAVAHCFEMTGRPSDGIEWIEARTNDWAVDNFFAVHNWWHLALFYLDLDARDRVLELYDTRIRGSRSENMLDLIDASSFLWRLHVLAIDVGDRWNELADTWARIGERGYYAFNDVHAVMAFAATGRTADVDAILAALDRATRENGTNAELSRRVGLPAARAIAAFAAGRTRTALELLFPLRVMAHESGGSNAQRDFLDMTLVEAAFRSNELGLARAFVDSRIAEKPFSPSGYRSLARIFDSSAPDLAAAARRKMTITLQQHRAALAPERDAHAAE